MHVPEIYKLRRTIDTIERLQGGGERSIRMEELGVLVDLLTDGHIFLTAVLPEDFTTLRGRYVRTSPYEKAVEMGTRDPRTVHDFGRCHNPQHPVLYASNNLETVYAELGADVGARIQVATIRKKPNEQIRYTCIGNMDHVRRHGKALLGDEEEVKIVRDYWNTLSELERLRHNLVDAFFADKFRQPARYSHEYKATSLFSKIIFGQGIDVFFYPSVGHLGGWNIAITPHAFERGFEIVSCEVNEVIDTPGYGIFASKPIFEHGSIQDGGFVWKTPSETMAFGSFDEYIWYHLSAPSQKTLIFQLMQIANDEFKPGDFETALGGKPPENTVNLALKLTTQGSFELKYDRDFDYVLKSLAGQERWDFMACDVISTVNADAIELAQTEFFRDIAGGKKHHTMFSNNGIWLPPQELRGPLAKQT